MVRASPAHLAALSLRAAQLLVRESVQVGVSAAEEPVAGPAHGALPGSEGARGGGAGCVRTAAPAPPRASPLHPGPRTPLGSTTHRARAGPVALQHAVGLVVARAGRAVGAEALAAPVAAGLLVAHEAGLALAALEGALSGAGGGGRAGLEGSAAAAPSGAGALRSGLPATPRRAAPRQPYPSVETHGVGDAVVLPGLTLVDVGADLGGGRSARRRVTEVRPSPPTPARPSARPHSQHPQPLAARASPHLLAGLGEGQPDALVAGPAVPGRAGLAAEARAGVHAAHAGEARVGVALGAAGPAGQRGRALALGGSVRRGCRDPPHPEASRRGAGPVPGPCTPHAPGGTGTGCRGGRPQRRGAASGGAPVPGRGGGGAGAAAGTPRGLGGARAVKGAAAGAQRGRRRRRRGPASPARVGGPRPWGAAAGMLPGWRGGPCGEPRPVAEAVPRRGSDWGQGGGVALGSAGEADGRTSLTSAQCEPLPV